MLTINDLVGIIRTQIRDNGTTQVFSDVAAPGTSTIIPNSSRELTLFAWAALGDFSRYHSLRKRYTLDIVQGQTIYPLPEDWLGRDPQSFERAVEPYRHDGEHEGWQDLWEYRLPYVPLSALLSQNRLQDFAWYDDSREIVMNIPPTNTYALTFDYFARHSPQTLPIQWHSIAMLTACARALDAIATDQSVKLQLYRIRNELTVDNRTISDKLRKQADDYRAQFKTEVRMQAFGAM